MASEETVRRLAAMVPAEDYAKFEALARSRERTVAAELRLAVREWLQARAEEAA